MDAILSAKAISKSFHRKAVLKDISFSIERPGIFILLGPNGAGKTTLLKILATLLLPDSGSVHILGLNTAHRAETLKPLLSFAPGEDKGFYARLTARQNLDFYARLYGLGSSEIRSRIAEAQRFLDIDSFDKPYQEYSAGLKQRISLAKSFLHDAQIYFMDEPTKSLDPDSRNTFLNLINRKFKEDRSKTLIMTTHNLEEAELLGDTIAIMNQGSIRISGSLQQLRSLSGKFTLKEIYSAVSDAEATL